MHLRQMASRALFTAVAMSPLSSIDAKQSADSERMSPAGRAVFEALYRNPDADLRKCVKDGKIIELQLIKAGEKPVFDWASARILLKKQAKLNATCLEKAQARSIDLMDRLPANDRALFYRTLHQPTSPPPVIMLPSVKKLPE